MTVQTRSRADSCQLFVNRKSKNASHATGILFNLHRYVFNAQHGQSGSCLLIQLHYFFLRTRVVVVVVVVDVDVDVDVDVAVAVAVDVDVDVDVDEAGSPDRMPRPLVPT